MKKLMNYWDLKLGADDFVKKSGGFSIKVLIERIRVQLRKKI